MKANDVISNLIKLYHENKLSHAYLIETNNVDNCYNDLMLLVKNMSCPLKYENNCENCNICHLVDNNIFPNLKIIEPEGLSIKKDAIENLKSTFLSVPIYGKNNIYIIKYPEKLNPTAFNRLLKFLEEPEDNIVGFYLTINKDKVAPTILSRCEIIKMMYDNEIDFQNNGKYDEMLTLANQYVSLIESKNQGIVEFNNFKLFPMIQTREAVVSLFKIIYTIYEKRLSENNNKTLLIQKLKLINKYLDRLNYNVNTNLLINSFGLEMSDLNEL